MTFSLSVGSKFACIAIEGVSVASSLEEPLDLGNGLWALDRPPFEVDDVWKQSLGSLQAEDYSRSNLLLFAVGASERPQVPDDENKALEATVNFLFYGLLLHGIPTLGHGLILQGANETGAVDVRSISTLQTHFPHYDVIPATVGAQALRGAAATGNGIGKIFEGVDGRSAPMGGPQDFRRLRRGFGALIRAIREQYWDSRLHQFVRSLDALIMLKPGEGQKKFAYRGQTFIGASEESYNLLRSLYILRNYTEHMNDWEPALVECSDPIRTFSLRSFQAEILAFDVYQRVLKDDALREHFRNDESITRFWDSTDDKIREIWGAPVDLAQRVNKRYNPVHGWL